MSNKLRIVYQNLVNSTAPINTSSTASAATPSSNLTKDTKSLVWRSATSPTAAKANLVLSFPSTIVGGVILPFCNLSSEATIRIRGYTGNTPTLGSTTTASITTTSGSNIVTGSFLNIAVGDVLSTNSYTQAGTTVLIGSTTTSLILSTNALGTVSNYSTLFTSPTNSIVNTLSGGPSKNDVITTTGTLIFDSGAVLAAPYQPLGLWSWGSLPLGVNSYSYGGGTYGRVWLPDNQQLACTSILIEILDVTNISGYIELSRLVIGAYWSPKFNTSFGLSTNTKDLSTHQRSESGDLVTNRGTRHNSMSFDLKWLTPIDRLEFTRILKGNGLPKPLFISLFPDSSEDWSKEQSHQIYGKLSQLVGIEHSIFDIYSTSIEIEEV